MFGIRTYMRHAWNRFWALRIKSDENAGNSVDVFCEDLKEIDIEIHGKNNSVTIENGCRLEKFKICIRGDGNSVLIGKNSSISGTKFLFEGRGCQLLLGENCIIAGNYSTISLEGAKSRIAVGRNCRFPFGGLNLSAHEDGCGIEIGEDCLFSVDAIVRTSDDHGIFSLVDGKRVNEAKSVNIGNHVWLAPYVTLLKGSGIADGCIVGSNFVVTKKFSERNCVIAGNPAKVVRHGVFWEKDLSRENKAETLK